MEFSAIYHETDKRYCYAVDKGRFVFRIKTKKDDMRRVTLHYQDKYIDVKRQDTRQKIEMCKAVSDRFSDYYEAELDMDVICLRYFFELTDQAGQISYYGNYEFSDEVIESIDYMFDCPQNLREEEMFLVPEWAKNKVVYQIFPSRFASDLPIDEKKWYQAPIGQKENLGGNLRGIINHLAHMKELGIDVLYMTPVFASDSMHKYDTIDYYSIDPGFGTEADLAELVEKAHSMGMKVILDGVFNHTSPKFFAFADVEKDREKSRYRDWYYIEEFSLKAERYKKPNFKTFAYYGGMPKLNLRNPETAEYFINVGLYWIRKCNIDGWRLDVGDEIGHRFWKQFREAIKQEKPDALIVGEVWHYAPDFLEGDEWDSVMNYTFFFSVLDFVAAEKITASRFLANLDFLRGNLNHSVYPVLWNLIDSHDTARFLHISGGCREKLKLAAALQLLLPGMPMIYYGDEYGMLGMDEVDCRRGMVWDAKYQDADMYEWYRTLIRLRKEYPCITEGMEVNRNIEDAQGLIIFTKDLAGKRMTVMFHGRNGEIPVAGYDGMINLLNSQPFSGKVGAFETAVLSETHERGM